jgi:hypothetical protein
LESAKRRLLPLKKSAREAVYLRNGELREPASCHFLFPFDGAVETEKRDNLHLPKETPPLELMRNFVRLTLFTSSEQNVVPLPMKTLAERIRRELESETAHIGHCAIYEPDLQRLWPIDEVNRKQKIALFANEYGFKLSFYKRGLCAIFERDIPAKAHKSTRR